MKKFFGLAGTAVIAVMAPLAAPAQAQTATPKAAAEPASPASTAYPSTAAGDGNTVGGYNQSRWAEDWRKLCDPAKRDDPIDALKCVKLTQDGKSYITFSGELRTRVNLTTNPNLREVEQQRQDIARIVGGADVHLGDHFRVFGELGRAELQGINLGSPAGNLRNQLTVQQLFAEVKGKALGLDVGVRAGRQEFFDGPQLLTVGRDNNTLYFVLDGVRAYARGKNARVDLFDLNYVNYGFGGISDDKTNPDVRFTGATFGFRLSPKLFGGSKLFLDPFIWRLRNRRATWGGVIAPEERYFLGLHAYGDAGPVNIDWTLNNQRGTFGNRDISAWQAFIAQTYRLGKKPDAPRVGFHVDYGSGGGTYDRSGDLNTTSGLFGNNIYYSYGLFLTPTNLLYAAPNFTFTPLKGVRLATEYGFAWRPDEFDAVYRASGAAWPGTQNVRGKKIGEVARLQAVWTITPRLSFTGRYEHFRAGEVLDRANLKSSDFWAGWLSFRF
ncbi:alginate export family protein [Sphingomonas sanguinis]|uniref:alginate export family protein n=1 Tax=Sphingomonas sp. LC-1 TaxID=3110957 RepID=UPI0021BA6C4D|nr:alginate export family protein [Sphingomonas sp. LC-1]MCT8000281.1 alginate export family protein [Sphingomonas sp. LC-1]